MTLWMPKAKPSSQGKDLFENKCPRRENFLSLPSVGTGPGDTACFKNRKRSSSGSSLTHLLPHLYSSLHHLNPPSIPPSISLCSLPPFLSLLSSMGLKIFTRFIYRTRCLATDSLFPSVYWTGCNENEADHLDRDQQPYPPSQKTKRMRTSFKHHQLRTMKSYFAINHNPDAKDLKQLAQKTGLTKRVLQVRSRITGLTEFSPAPAPQEHFPYM